MTSPAANSQKRSLVGDNPKWLVIVTIVMLGLMCLPTIIVAVYSFNGINSVVLKHGWSLNWYYKVWHSDLTAPMLLSLWVGLVSTMLSVLIGTLTALSIARGDAKLATIVLSVLVLRLLAPETATAVSSFMLFVALGTPTNNVTLILGHVSLCVPVVSLVILSGLGGSIKEIEDAAMDLGSTRFRAIYRAILPPLMPTIIAAAMLAFVFSFTDFITSQFTSGLTSPTLPVRIYSARGGVTPAIDAVGLMMLLLVLLVAAVGAIILTVQARDDGHSK